MRHMIYLVEELVSFCTEPVRRIVAVCANTALADEFIDAQGGNQMMLTATGEILPKYKVTEKQILCTASDIEKAEAYNV